DPEVSNCLMRDPGLIMFTYVLQRTAIQRSAIVSSKIRGWSCSLTIYNVQRSRGQQLSHPRSVIEHVHLLSTTNSTPEVSNCLMRDPELIMFTYVLQRTAIQRSAIVSSKIRGWSCSLTSYNVQRSRGEQLSHPRSGVDHVHLRSTTHSDPEVSNCLIQDPWLMMFTYLLQRTAIQRSAIVSSKIRG